MTPLHALSGEAWTVRCELELLSWLPRNTRCTHRRRFRWTWPSLGFAAGRNARGDRHADPARLERLLKGTSTGASSERTPTGRSFCG